MLSNILQFKKQINYFFTGDFNYTRLANSDLISQMTRPNGVTSSWSYEDKRDLLTQVQNGSVSDFGYTNNAIGNRTAMSRAGSAFSAPDTISYSYNSRSEVIGAVSNQNSAYNYAYSVDPIGNRLTANENSAVTNYTSNLLNQYTLINSAVPNYDADGNMTSSGNGWVYTYNGENRITQATKGSTAVTMAYDYAGRRISKTVTTSGVVQNSYKYVYDGFKLIAVYNNNDLVMTFTWQPESLGMDVPVSMTYAGATYYYVTDGNKNVTALLDASGNRVAKYVYGPFGQTVSAAGSMSQINPFRFSSEFHDDETGLVYYNYRYYSPELGRWTKRDPIEEEGGWNLYVMIGNNVNNKMDKCGLLGFPSWDPRTWWNRFHWYGNWGGPGWAAGGWVEDGWSNETPGKKNADATDALDECYKNHDICYEKCRDDLICESDIKRCFSDCDYASLLCQLRATFNFKNNVALYNRWQGVAGTIALGGQGVTRDAVNVTVTAAGVAKDVTVNIAIKTASTVKNTAVATAITVKNTAVATAITVKNTAVATATTVENVAIEVFDRAKNAWNWATTW